MSKRDGKGDRASPKKGSPKKGSTNSSNESLSKAVMTQTSPRKEEVADAPVAGEKQLKEKPVTLEEGDVEETASQSSQGAVGASWSGWFANTFSSAKEMSTEMFEYLKHDISEFTDTVTEAGKDLKDKLKLEENAKFAVDTVGEKVNVVLEQMSTIFGVGPEDDDEEIVAGSIRNSSRSVVDRVQAKIYALASHEVIFLEDPEDAEAYDKWLETFDLEKKHEEMTEQLAANPHLQLHYSNLVPDKVSHVVFWHRFYYRVQAIIEAEEKREKEEKQNESSSNDLQELSHGAVVGDETKSDTEPGPELTEEEQKRLLAAYEEELKTSDESAKHSRSSSGAGTQLSTSSSVSGSFAIVTKDPDTNELKVE